MIKKCFFIHILLLWQVDVFSATTRSYPGVVGFCHPTTLNNEYGITAPGILRKAFFPSLTDMTLKVNHLLPDHAIIEQQKWMPVGWHLKNQATIAYPIKDFEYCMRQFGQDVKT